MWSTDIGGKKESTEHNPKMDQMLDLTDEDFKAAILQKELEDSMLKIFKEDILFNVWTEHLSRKIQTTKKEQIGNSRSKKHN